jgi:DnaJ-class molecular chaperone
LNCQRDRKNGNQGATMNNQDWVMRDCEYCRGTGNVYGNSRLRCPECHGAGEYEVMVESEDGEGDDE